MQRMAAWRDAFFRKIGIGAALEQQLYDFDMSTGGRVAERRAGARVVGHVVRGAVGERGVAIEQLCYALDIADVRGRANVAVRAAGTEVSDHGGGRGGVLLAHVAPAAKIVIAVGELN